MPNPNFPNFDLSELRCADGTDVPMELIPNAIKLLVNLQVLRDFLGTPVKINSGYRTKAYNTRIGGAKASAHLSASAADIVVPGVPAATVHMILTGLMRIGAIHDGGLGRYKNFNHYDIGKRRRWNG